jgi:hypothetical protein
MAHWSSRAELLQVPSTRQESRVQATLSSQSAARMQRRAAMQPGVVGMWSQAPPMAQRSCVQATRSSQSALEAHMPDGGGAAASPST